MRKFSQCAGLEGGSGEQKGKMLLAEELVGRRGRRAAQRALADFDSRALTGASAEAEVVRGARDKGGRGRRRGQHCGLDNYEKNGWRAGLSTELGGGLCICCPVFMKTDHQTALSALLAAPLPPLSSSTSIHSRRPRPATALTSHPLNVVHVLAHSRFSRPRSCPPSSRSSTRPSPPPNNKLYP